MYGGLHSPDPLPSAGVLLEVARVFTPRVEAPRPTPVLLDLRGLGRSWPSADLLGRALLEAVQGRSLAAHVAIAWTRVASLLVARSQAGLTIVPAGGEADILAPLPLTLLDLEPARAEQFRRWGLRTLGDLAALPATGLAERLGPDGARLQRLARGEDEIPLVPTPLPETFSCSLDLDWPVDGLEPLSFLLARVLDPLCDSLRRKSRRAAALTLDLRLVDGRIHTRRLAPAAASAEPRTWRTLLLLDLEAHPPGDAIQAVAVRAEPTPARAVQFSLLDPAQPSPEKLAETLGRLQVWTSAGRAGAVSLLDTHRPGAFVLGSFAPGPFVAPSTKPAPLHVALRPFRPPRPAQVILRNGAPAFVAAGSLRGAVVDCAGPWRASGDWWDVAWSREEWDVALAGGGVYRVFLDRLREAWFLEGEID